MPHPAAPRAVVFDLGNTLWFEARSPDMAQIWRLQAESVAPLLDRWRMRVEGDLESLLEDIWRAYETACRIDDERGTYREPSLPFIIRGALAARNTEISGTQAEDWWRASWIPVRHFGYQLYPDVLDVLRNMHARGLKTAINTNRPCTAAMLWPDLEDMGLAEYVDIAVCSGDTGFVKPHRSTFELVTTRLGCRAADVVMVGDLCGRDCAGARAVGMTTVLKLNGRHGVPPCSDADYSIHDLGELLALPIFGGTNPPLAAIESLTPHEDENADRY